MSLKNKMLLVFGYSGVGWKEDKYSSSFVFSWILLYPKIMGHLSLLYTFLEKC